MTQGRAAVILHGIFSPQGDVPPALTDIYKVIEKKEGVLISFNYDGIAERQLQFPVILPHGSRPRSLLHPISSTILIELVEEFDFRVPTHWHLPFPENAAVRSRPEYQEMLCAWQTARSVILVGYGFGSGADALSFEDFGRHVHPDAHVHVLCPRPDNVDLCKQVGHVLCGRPRGFRVFGQPFRWRSFAEAVLEVLKGLRSNHIRATIGREFEIALAHDRR